MLAISFSLSTETSDTEEILPWRRFEPSDVQLDFHRSNSTPKLMSNASDLVNGVSFPSRPLHSVESDHDSMKCLSTCCYRLPTLHESVSVGEHERICGAKQTASCGSYTPVSPDPTADVLPPPWKILDQTDEPSAGHVPTSSRTHSEHNSGPQHITESTTCHGHSTWTGTGVAHYRGSRRNSLVPTATGSSRRRCSHNVSAAEQRTPIFDGDDDESLMMNGRAERSLSWLMDCPMTIEDGVSERSHVADKDLSSPLLCDDAHSDVCHLPTAKQILMNRSHSACDLSTLSRDHQFSIICSSGLKLSKFSVPNLAFI